MRRTLKHYIFHVSPVILYVVELTSNYLGYQYKKTNIEPTTHCFVCYLSEYVIISKLVFGENKLICSPLSYLRNTVTGLDNHKHEKINEAM